MTMILVTCEVIRQYFSLVTVSLANPPFVTKLIVFCAQFNSTFYWQIGVFDGGIFVAASQFTGTAWYATICISLAYYGLLRKHIYRNILHLTFPTQRFTACNQALQLLPEKPIIPYNLIPHQVGRDVVGDGWDIPQLHHTLIALMIIWMNPLKFWSISIEDGWTDHNGMITQTNELLLP